MTTFWVQFWAWLLVSSLALFLGLAVVVSVGGLLYIRALVGTLRKEPGGPSAAEKREGRA